MEVGEFATKLTSRLLISNLHQSEAGGASEHIAVGAFQKTGGIAVTLLALMIQKGDMMEILTVPRLQGTVHTEVEQAATVLDHTVHVVAGQRLVGLVLLLEHTELVAVVAVDTVAGGDPQESVMVEIDLRHETTGQLMVVSCEIFAHLGMDAHG